MRRFAQIGFALALGLVMSCASAHPQVYDAAAAGSVSTWYVGFEYDVKEVQQRGDSTGVRERRETSAGFTHRELQLRDDIFFRLKDRHQLAVLRAPASGAGTIALHPTSFRSRTGFETTDVLLYAPDGTLVARTRVTNSSHPATFKDDEAFATFVADAVADLIAGKRS